MIKLHAKKNIVRKYYKYIDWQQPVLTSNTSYGVISSDTAYTGYGNHLYSALTQNTYPRNNEYISNTTLRGQLVWELPLKIKITSCNVHNSNETSYTGRTPRSCILYASNDGSNWSNVASYSNSDITAGGYNTLNVNNPLLYKYYKWEFGASNGTSPGISIAGVEITAEYAIETTQDDYDFYIDEKILLTPKINNIFYASTQGR